MSAKDINNIENYSEESLKELKTIVKDLYLSDSIPWVVGYSGGKDSTAVLQLVWSSIEELDKKDRTKNVYIINTDTLVESPIIAKWVDNSLEKMRETAKEKSLPFKVHKLIPEFNQTFWVNFIGRGYPFPRKKLRWCTDRLKIKPVNKFIQDQIVKHGEIIMVLGTRKAESAARAKKMTYYESKRVREFLSPNPTLINELIFSPISEWSDNDVWTYLMQHENPWGIKNTELLTLYKGATQDNECPMMVEKDLPSCGKSRFGCWVCTMVEKDKSMEAMITNDVEKNWLIPLLEFRNEFGAEEGDREKRSFRKLGGFLRATGDRLHHGPYLKDVREYYLRRLLEVEKEIQETAPKEFKDIQLITLEELRVIRNIWVNDKHEFDDSLPRIYKDVTGKDFEDPKWISNNNFNEKDWEILKNITEEQYGDEELMFELMYSLIDIESKSKTITKRKGIIKKLEDTLTSTFYKNEEDAADYYVKKIQRKDEMLNDNDKYFDNIEDMTSEDELEDMNNDLENSSDLDDKKNKLNIKVLNNSNDIIED